jgi:ParE toxin of type II toxin-antitoxin system, parDE
VKIVFLETAQLDVIWFREYYRLAFPAGKSNAAIQVKESKLLLKTYPQVGNPLDTVDLCELPILRTPFVLIYRIRHDEIQIVRLWDQRAERPQSWT